MIQPFLKISKESNDLQKALIPTLGQAGELFFKSESSDDNVGQVLRDLQSLDSSYLEALRLTAPDFFAWAGH